MTSYESASISLQVAALFVAVIGLQQDRAAPHPPRDKLSTVMLLLLVAVIGLRHVRAAPRFPWDKLLTEVLSLLFLVIMFVTCQLLQQQEKNENDQGATKFSKKTEGHP